MWNGLYAAVLCNKQTHTRKKINNSRQKMFYKTMYKVKMLWLLGLIFCWLLVIPDILLENSQPRSEFQKRFVWHHYKRKRDINLLCLQPIKDKKVALSEPLNKIEEWCKRNKKRYHSQFWGSNICFYHNKILKFIRFTPLIP